MQWCMHAAGYTRACASCVWPRYSQDTLIQRLRHQSAVKCRAAKCFYLSASCSSSPYSSSPVNDPLPLVLIPSRHPGKRHPRAAEPKRRKENKSKNAYQLVRFSAVLAAWPIARSVCTHKSSCGLLRPCPRSPGMKPGRENENGGWGWAHQCQQQAARVGAAHTCAGNPATSTTQPSLSSRGGSGSLGWR